MVIDDVELPKWAASPEEFVMLHRAVSDIHLSKQSCSVYSKIIAIMRSFFTDWACGLPFFSVSSFHALKRSFQHAQIRFCEI